MSADAERANLDNHQCDKVPEDPRLASGIPPEMRLEEEAFVQLTGLTRPSPEPEETVAEPSLAPPAPEPAVEISFGEPGVLDVDEGEHDGADGARPSESVAALRALVADLERDADGGAATEAVEEPVAEDAPDRAEPPAPPLRPSSNLEELEQLIQALEDQPRDDEDDQPDEVPEAT